MEEGTAEEKLTSGSNDPDPTGNNTLQGAGERGTVDRMREEGSNEMEDGIRQWKRERKRDRKE